MKYYDPENKRLVYIEEKASPDYWDKHWAAGMRKRLRISKKTTYATKISRCYLNPHTRITRKYLKPEQGPILEGGCGLGKKVEVLCFCGFQCIGVDYARETVKIVNEHIPELDVRYGDIRKLDFPDDYFAGYWSIGVIEHFWDGYDKIAEEMKRVIKPGGYLFLSIPYMSLLRKIKAKAGCYVKWANQSTEDFRQFALNHRNVMDEFSKKGFVLIEKKAQGLLFGLKDEFSFLTPLINGILRHKDQNFLTKIFYLILDSLSSLLFGRMFGHMILLVLRKRKKSVSV